ncbi:hypothetical protein VE00_10950 [Pseudogymnoascus sp. WSF 3629]|nr:hypothetical protein VE00_10950 [Pseudogymnoascus sp. WSF 3629]
MADDLYIAADERARDARRAGLQAKKDEQPLNTTRSYASKQREWKARLLPSPLQLVPHAARCPGRLSAQLAGRRARHARQARGLAEGGHPLAARKDPVEVGAVAIRKVE